MPAPDKIPLQHCPSNQKPPPVQASSSWLRAGNAVIFDLSRELLPERRQQVRIETIDEGGFGGFARVLVQLRNAFPGPGGLVLTEQDMVAAYRLPLCIEYKPETEQLEEGLRFDSIAAQNALAVFLRHTLAKKLDDYFFRRGEYRFAHIPRPLGCDGHGGYLYEWTYGADGFPADYYDPELRRLPVDLDEENKAAACFGAAGIGLLYDTCEFETPYRKNIIIQESNWPCPPESLSNLWKRIDFGPESLPIDYQKLAAYINGRCGDMVKYLGAARVEMMELALGCLLHAETPASFPHFERLLELLYDYRKSTARHMGVEPISPSRKRVHYQVEIINEDTAAQLSEPHLVRRLRTSSSSTLDLEIRRSFPCRDGVIYTQQDLPVARLTRVGANANEGFHQFLRHFLVKKLENAFISWGRYGHAHIARPLGSAGPSYYYEWEYGDERCLQALLQRPHPSNKESGLDDWFEFVTAFREAGIEMEHNLRFIPSTVFPGQTVAKQIIIRQPRSPREDTYLSRMWLRVNFHERATPIDLDRLEGYLTTRRDELLEHLTPPRYPTMLLAVRYLKGELNEAGFKLLLQGIRRYRISALRHLNFHGFEPPAMPEHSLKVRAD